MTRWLGKMLLGSAGPEPPPAGWFASPTGSATGDGTIDDPWSLTQATLGGYPVTSVKVPTNPVEVAAATNVVWLRGGVYQVTPTTADMEGTPITKVVTGRSYSQISSSTNPWVPGDVGRSITVHGVGTNGGGADLSATITGYYNAGEVLLNKQVEVGTFFACRLIGTAAYPITFRGYPGERAIIDGNVDPDISGTLYDNFSTHNWGEHIVLQDLESTNSNPNRMCSPWFDQSASNGGVDGDARGLGVTISAPTSSIINCIFHDTGNGIFTGIPSKKWIVHGCLMYFNGMYAPVAEQNQAAAVDLAPSGGTAVALSGAYRLQQAAGTSITMLSFVNSGDYLLVTVAKNGLNYAICTTDFTVTDPPGDVGTYSMTLLSGQNGYSKSVAVFGLAGHTGSTGTITCQSHDTNVVRAIAQSFVNVGTVTVGGMWFNNQWANAKDGASIGTFTRPNQFDIGAATASDTNHLVVDGAGLYGSTSINSGTSGDNAYIVADAVMNATSSTLTSTTGGFTTAMVGLPCYVTGAAAAGAVLRTTISARPDANTLTLAAAASTSVTGATARVMYMLGGIMSGTFGGGPFVRMSYATRTGAGDVNMHWGWTMLVYPHGHGTYCQAGDSVNVTTTGGSKAISCTASVWDSLDPGAFMRITDGMAPGVDLVTSIDVFTDAKHVILLDAPAVGGLHEANWSYGCSFKNNITFEEVSLSIQTYGSSGAAANGVDLTGNLWVHSRAFFGGLGGFRLADSYNHGNYFYDLGINIGDQMNHMRNYRFEDNYCDGSTANGNASATWDQMIIQNNTFIGTLNDGTPAGEATFEANWPTNDYTYIGSDPATNVIRVIGNDYETNRCNIIVYNWEDLATVDVDISSAVAAGTEIYVMNARDYFATPVWSGTYSGGSITLPQAGTLSDLTVATPIGGPGGTDLATFTAQPSYAPRFAAFIVRKKSKETWRLLA